MTAVAEPVAVVSRADVPPPVVAICAGPALRGLRRLVRVAVAAVVLSVRRWAPIREFA